MSPKHKCVQKGLGQATTALKGRLGVIEVYDVPKPQNSSAPTFTVSLSLSTSRIGGPPKSRLYSRLN
jgi:hypothetical protein